MIVALFFYFAKISRKPLLHKALNTLPPFSQEKIILLVKIKCVILQPETYLL